MQAEEPGQGNYFDYYDITDGDEEDYSEDMSDTETEDLPWIEWFCRQPAHVHFCEVDYDYAADDFNLSGLSQEVDYYRYALSIILDIDDNSYKLSDLTEKEQAACDSSAQVLYGLIHARYILTNAGMSKMSQKFEDAVWGYCPNVNCGKPVLPLGLSDHPGQRTLVFCPGCNEAYVPSQPALADLDGAFFGTTFAGLFAMEHDLSVMRLFYQPRVFGFRVHPGVKDQIRAQKLNGKQQQAQLTAAAAAAQAQQQQEKQEKKTEEL